MLLALDTTGPFCSAALHDGEQIVASRSDEIGRGHAEYLMPMLEELLAEHQTEWSDIKRIACTTGPGSFTGLRVGLATARGLALALNCPCVGVTVFEAFRFGETTSLAVVIDAKRDQVWIQVFGVPDADSVAPVALSINEVSHAVPKSVTRLAGSAAPIIAGLNSRFEVLTDKSSPPIEGVAGHAVLSDSREFKPKPLYLRLPDAKKQTPELIRT